MLSHEQFALHDLGARQDSGVLQNPGARLELAALDKVCMRDSMEKVCMRDSIVTMIDSFTCFYRCRTTPPPPRTLQTPFPT